MYAVQRHHGRTHWFVHHRKNNMKCAGGMVKRDQVRNLSDCRPGTDLSCVENLGFTCSVTLCSPLRLLHCVEALILVEKWCKVWDLNLTDMQRFSVVFTLQPLSWICALLWHYDKKKRQHKSLMLHLQKVKCASWISDFRLTVILAVTCICMILDLLPHISGIFSEVSCSTSPCSSEVCSDASLLMQTAQRMASDILS